MYLHCFEYGDRKRASELEQYCKQVFYYPRHTGIASLLSSEPYNVRSRRSAALTENLLKNNFPILAEVLHTCYVFADPRFQNRKKLYREVNIEHDYYHHLAQGEKRLLKKRYLLWEARKLKRFESIVSKADAIAVVSATDRDHFQRLYPQLECALIPCFHEFDEVKIREGKSDYVLYHGNLGVSENYVAADWLIDHVFSKMKHRVIIAGLNPPAFLKEKIGRYAHIELRENCTMEEMNELIEHAQIHCLYTQQATGLKLKLLNALYRGRFVIANDQMLSGTGLEAACAIANTADAYLKQIDALMSLDFTPVHLAERRLHTQPYNNSVKIETLIRLLE